MLIERTAVGPVEFARCAVCVVGAGPAGITLALSLARRGVETILLESGDLRHDPRIQALGDAADLDERRHAPMNIATQRGWGGASRIWGGRCLPLDPVDFENSSLRAGAQWPFGFSELAPYYSKACETVLCGADSFAAGRVFGPSSQALVPGLVDGDVVCSSLERWSLPTDFGKVYEGEVRSQRSLRAFLGFTCLSLNFESECDRVSGLISRSIDGRQLTVQARYFVLAAGGLETTRLLMSSDSVHPGGVGNHADLLGRYYMGHVSGKIAEIQFTTPGSRTLYGFERDSEGVYCRRRFVVSGAVQRQHGLGNCALWLDNPALSMAGHRNGILSLGYLALRAPFLARRLAPEAIRRAIVEQPVRSSVRRHLWNVFADAPRAVSYVVPFLWKRYFAQRRLPGFFVRSSSNRYALHYHGEHLPNALSRVCLSNERDELGLRRLKIDIRYSDGDVDNVRRTHEIVDGYLRKLGVGYLEYQRRDVDHAILLQARDGIHQIGTTRMSARPERGVVDANCRVHGIKNLYVASSSVFPTSGQANPTLTIVALSLRLADHLRSELTLS
jgi:choline dehydrogenase-like flavoprotein